jgi:hypothetical protein
MEYYETANEGLDSKIREQLQKTPWWMISVAVHAVLLMIGYFVAYSTPTVRPPVDVQMDVAEIDDDPFEEPLELPEKELDAEINSDEPPIEDPIINDNEVSDHDETDTNSEFEETSGEDDDAKSDKPFTGKSWNTAIGVGGGLAGGRTGRGGRRNLVRSGGGSRKTEESVDRGLDWLVRHQSKDGSWSCNNFAHRCKKNICDGAGSTQDYTPGTSALALLAFLADGNSTRHGRYREVVRRGAKYLVSIQTPDGCVGPKVADGHYMYNHAIATMALAEAYGQSNHSPMLKAPAQKAVDFLLSAQNPYLGWRYGVRPGDNDTSITGWAVLALKAAKLSELNVSPEGFAGAKNWIDKVTDDSFYKTGYTQKGDNGAREAAGQRYQPTEAMTAAGLASKMFMGSNPGDPDVRGAATLLKNMPPKWDAESGNDFYYWYYGSLAMFQVGGDYWRAWNAGMKSALVETQRRGGDESGSWDPLSAWGHSGGRVYATAINVLTLEVYYRHQKLNGEKRKK